MKSRTEITEYARKIMAGYQDWQVLSELDYPHDARRNIEIIRAAIRKEFGCSGAVANTAIAHVLRERRAARKEN